MPDKNLPTTPLATSEPPNEEQLETLLTRIQPKPGKHFYAQMNAQPWMYEGPSAMKHINTSHRGLTVALGSVVVIALTVFGFVATSQSSTLTFGYATATPIATQLPTTATAAVVVPGITPTPQPTVVPLPTRDPSYPLTVDEAGNQSGFNVVAPGYIPNGFGFTGAAYETEQRRTVLSYAAGDGDALTRPSILFYIYQQRLEDYVVPQCPECEPDHLPEIEQVQVGGSVGAYVGTSWVSLQPNPEATPVWSHTSALRSLEWSTDTMHYRVFSLGREEVPGNLDKEELVAIAQSIAMCNEPPSSVNYLCEVGQARTVAEFRIKLPPDIAGLLFAGASAEPDAVHLRYIAVGGGSELTISQTLTENASLLRAELPDAATVETVNVGGFDGEYAQGAPVTKPGETTTAWEPTAPARHLRWYENGVLFDIHLMGHTASVEYLEKDTLIALAESLVYDSPPVSVELRADHLTSIADAETLSGLELLEPAFLPEGFAFRYAEYNAEVNNVRSMYEFGEGSGVAGIVIFQLPSSGAVDRGTDGLPPEAVVRGQVQGHPAIYVQGYWEVPYGYSDPGKSDPATPSPTSIWHDDSSHQYIMWQQDGMEISVNFFASESYEGEMTQTLLFAVAESMK